MNRNKQVWWECHTCGLVLIQKPEDLTCPECYGNMERRSRRVEVK